MGKIGRFLIVVGLVLVMLGAGAGILVLRTGYSIQEMDWNSDGETTVSEMLRAIDIGRRSIRKDGLECQEYFSFKDGLPVRVVCPPARE
ncbi:hypothetical protein [Pseudothauera rhizosphaerae]|uniref:Uncharacterized protein n=1 Tax=Pseudothauera rhizosphaerae TaxID=2565932 RepID=A0A4S4AQE1_9RHOO|nr:hypothetical protein [Pseudothauera rhizosphaerae]THF61970.1 hypothetical protein E6O51_07340 [Pseudothauera rhizosphaerae]